MIDEAAEAPPVQGFLAGSVHIKGDITGTGGRPAEKSPGLTRAGRLKSLSPLEVESQA